MIHGLVPSARMGEPVTIEVPVAWGDMDAFGHVNNVVFLRWFESGRIALFGKVGVPHEDVGQQCAPILAKTTCNFVAPVKYPATVRVHTTIARIGNKSFTMAYRIERADTDAVVAQGDGVVVWYDYAAQASAAIPDDLRQRLSDYLV